MDALKRYVYWIVLGALIAVTVALYLFWAAPARRTREKLATKRGELDKWLKGRLDGQRKYQDFVKKNPGSSPSGGLKPIANNRHVKAAQAYKAELAKRTAAMVDVFKAHKLVVLGDEPIFPSRAPPPEQEWAWQEWVDRLYPPEREKTEGTVALPVPPDKNYEKPEWRETLLLRLGQTYGARLKSGQLWTRGGERASGPVTREEQERILRRYLLWRAIHIALRTAEARVPETHPVYKTSPTKPGERLIRVPGVGPVVVVGPEGREEPVVLDARSPHAHPHRVIQINRIEFGDLAESGTVKRPYRVKSVALEFVAHPAAVPEVLKRLQSQEDFVLSVRWIRMQQAGLGRSTVAEKDRLNPDRYYDPPVLVTLNCEILAFDETLDPVPKPAPPRPSASSRRRRGRPRRRR